MIIYLDKDFRCHAVPGDGLREVETDFFDGKCPEFIEGYRYIPTEESWTREDGEVFAGEMVTPTRDYDTLAEIQGAVERMQAELDAAYHEGVNSL